MKKLLSLLACFMFVASMPALAEEDASTSDDMNKVRKERMHKDKSEKRERRKEMRSEKRGEKGEYKHKGKSKCAQKCSVNREKVIKCRKEKGLKKGENGKGVCLSQKQRDCMKTCHKKMKSEKGERKGEMRKQRKDNAENSDRKPRRERKERQQESSEE